MNRTAFTIVELLVVVTIIVVLLSLLAPGIEKAKDAGMRVRCLANLKGLGNANIGYMLDYKFRYPYLSNWCQYYGHKGNNAYDNGNVYEITQRPLNEYLGYTSDGGEVPATRCPSDTGDPLTNVTTSLWEGIGTSYLIPIGQYSGVMNVAGVPSENAPPPRNHKKFKRTSNKILFADWVFYGNRPLTDSRTQRHCTNLERKKNILFLDNHAEWFFFEDSEFSDTYDPNNAYLVPNYNKYYY